MRYLLTLACLAVGLAAAAQAQTTPTCKAQAAEKKLAGAAKKSHLTKCVNDAKG